MNFLLKTRRQLLKEIKALKDRKGFLRAGLPRFDRLFGRDSLIAAWQLLDWNPGICKATLEVLSQLQGKVVNDEKEEEPGKIIHETDLEENWQSEGLYPYPYYGSVDSTSLFLIVFFFYFKKTKDIKFLKSHWGNILMALMWMEEYGDKDKDYFLEYQRKNPKGLFHQGWKDSFKNHLKIEPPVAIVEVQGYQYLALKNIAQLAEEEKDQETAKKLRERAEKLKKEFNEKFWMPKANYFALGLDKNKKQREAITSNPGHLLFTGILEENKIDLLVKRLFQEDLFTPYGIRTLSSFEPDFSPWSYHLGSVWPHDNWIIAQGLKKLGYKKEYEKIKSAVISVFRKLDLIPEFYGVIEDKIAWKDLEQVDCYPQAWATGALFNFLEVSNIQRRLFQIPSKIFRW
ncbi:MAG: amylo-alpha-1,6-glucosidase [bacterium]|nr:amylo-alpha-1,6-glucosidase [bacterium]